MLIINADDFGLDERHNRAVIQGFKSGLCSSATLMPNMPGFEEACQLAHEDKLLSHIGMHLVLRDGCPLTEKIKRFPRFCDKEGRLCLSRTGSLPILWFNTTEREVLAEEVRAQIKRCRAYGIPITHVDSHYHIHADWGVATILILLAQEQHIPYIRIARNCGPNIDSFKRSYKSIFNYRLEISRLARTKYFGDATDFIFLKRQGISLKTLKSFEVMIHPNLNDREMLVDETDNLPLKNIVQEIDAYNDAVSFSGSRCL